MDTIRTTVAVTIDVKINQQADPNHLLSAFHLEETARRAVQDAVQTAQANGFTNPYGELVGMKIASVKTSYNT